MDFLNGKRVGFAMTGSFCTLSQVMPQVAKMVSAGAKVVPIISEMVNETDTRFGRAEEWKERLYDITGCHPLVGVKETEPIGPKGLLDLLVVAPCTGNTLAKIAHGITDSVMTMAIKAHLRNERPLILALATNDGLGANLENIGRMLVRRNVYFVPFGQDDPISKPRSLIAHFPLLSETIAAARRGEQLQPILQ